MVDRPEYAHPGQTWEGSKILFRVQPDVRVRRMMRNLNSEEVAKIRRAMSQGGIPIGLERWYELVHPHAPWDHKEQFRRKFGIDNEKEEWLPLPGEDKKIHYDIWSNIRYGYVGRAAGIGWNTLDCAHRMKGCGQTDAGDIYTVRMGMELYEKYGTNLTREQFEQFIAQRYDELEKRGKIK